MAGYLDLSSLRNFNWQLLLCNCLCSVAKRAKNYTLNHDLHNVGGIVSVVLLSLVALTRAAMVYYPPVAAGLRWLMPSVPAPEVTSQVVAGKIPMTADELLDIAQTQFPTGQLESHLCSQTTAAVTAEIILLLN